MVLGGLFEAGAVGHGGVCSVPVVRTHVAHMGSKCLCCPCGLWVLLFMSILENRLIGAFSQVVLLPL